MTRAIEVIASQGTIIAIPRSIKFTIRGALEAMALHGQFYAAYGC